MQETVGESRAGKRERRNDNEKKMGNRIEKVHRPEKNCGKAFSAGNREGSRTTTPAINLININ